METYYLVDFENVNNEGLKNIDDLTDTDHVHIFYTEYAPNIRLDIALVEGVDIKGHNIPPGKQSVDLHLVSFLGYLLGMDEDNQYSYVIISKDKGYDNIIAYWKEYGYNRITRNAIIPAKKLNRSGGRKQQSSGNQTTTRKLSGQERCRLNQYVQHAMLDEGYNAPTANKICSLVVAVYGEDRALSRLHNLIRNEYYDCDYIEIYQDVKNILHNYEKESKENTNNTKKSSWNLNTQIQQAIAKAGYANEVVNCVASIVVRNAGTNYPKQNIHTALIREFGRQSGSDLYNRVKNYV